MDMCFWNMVYFINWFYRIKTILNRYLHYLFSSLKHDCKMPRYSSIHSLLINLHGQLIMHGGCTSLFRGLPRPMLGNTASRLWSRSLAYAIKKKFYHAVVLSSLVCFCIFLNYESCSLCQNCLLYIWSECVCAAAVAGGGHQTLYKMASVATHPGTPTTITVTSLLGCAVVCSKTHQCQYFRAIKELSNGLRTVDCTTYGLWSKGFVGWKIVGQ